MFGSGFKKVFSSCNANGVKFSYESNNDGFSFVFYRNDVTLNVTNNVTLNPMKKLIANDYKVLDALKENPNQTRENIASKLKINKRTVQRYLEKLVAYDYVIKIGSKKQVIGKS